MFKQNSRVLQLKNEPPHNTKIDIFNAYAIQTSFIFRKKNIASGSFWVASHYLSTLAVTNAASST